MNIGVISDTHLSSVSFEFTKIVDSFLKDCDLIIHCGDYTEEEVYNYLNSYSTFVGVKGNCDFFPLEEKKVLEIGSKKIGITHGYGVQGLSYRPENILSCFQQELDLICFGHTHQVLWKKINNTYLLNPGSLRFSASLALISWDKEIPQVKFLSL